MIKGIRASVVGLARVRCWLVKMTEREDGVDLPRPSAVFIRVTRNAIERSRIVFNST